MNIQIISIIIIIKNACYQICQAGNSEKSKSQIIVPILKN